jgi:hypothetical protein
VSARSTGEAWNNLWNRGPPAHVLRSETYIEVQAINVRGRFDVLDLRTGDGGIEATAEAGSKVEAAWSLRSGDGGITLRLPEGLSADLDAHTGDGGIVLDKPVTVRGTISPDTVRGKLGAGGLPLQIHTGDGSIRLLGL